MTREIPLTQDKVAIVDDADYEQINAHKWHAVRKRRKLLPDAWYAYRTAWDKIAKRYVTIPMHREIARTPDGMDTDHRDGDGLNNQRCNLRHATQTENGANAQYRPSSSGFRGVVWHKTGMRWQAQIRADNRYIYLGHFKDPEVAARVYDAAARRLHGDFARLNFPEGGEV